MDSSLSRSLVIPLLIVAATVTIVVGQQGFGGEIQACGDRQYLTLREGGLECRDGSELVSPAPSAPSTPTPTPSTPTPSTPSAPPSTVCSPGEFLTVVGSAELPEIRCKKIDAVESGIFPSGGTAGQILKRDITNTAIVWTEDNIGDQRPTRLITELIYSGDGSGQKDLKRGKNFNNYVSILIVGKETISWIPIEVWRSGQRVEWYRSDAWHSLGKNSRW